MGIVGGRALARLDPGSRLDRTPAWIAISFDRPISRIPRDETAHEQAYPQRRIDAIVERREDERRSGDRSADAQDTA